MLLHVYYRHIGAFTGRMRARTDINHQAQTPEQRKRNAKFAKEQTAKRGKPASEIKKKQNFKSPISPFWLGEFISSVAAEGYGLGGSLKIAGFILGFVVFGGLIFELLSRIFFR
ncbi:hypothetical protein LSUB1_G005572 [Lachnellula subtilissima]|uniref:Stress-associated endoplasmic reticulum protein n=1 Tax=Lachnellula subtilissima TaxID=602034 RepID=A0A8H8U9C2_9HELO|nr:hypothetical protein LSUB1_G005572 [Lachnellula subtilissima]